MSAPHGVWAGFTVFAQKWIVKSIFDTLILASEMMYIDEFCVVRI